MLRAKLARHSRTRLYYIALLIALLFTTYRAPVYAVTQAPGSVGPDAAQVTIDPWEAYHGMSASQYQARFDELKNRGFRPTFISGYDFNNQDYYAAIWEQRNGPAWVASHGITASAYQSQFNSLKAQGYRLTFLYGFSVNNEARFNAIWEVGSDANLQVRHGLTGDQYQTAFNELDAQGYRPVQVTGYSINNEARYAAVWEKRNGPAYVAQHGVTGDVYQAKFDELGGQGYRLVYLNGFSVNGEDRFNAIWEQRGGSAMDVRHGLTDAEYQAVFDDLALRGFKLTLVSGYNIAGDLRYATIWEEPVPPFSSLPETGNPVPELDVFDQTMQNFMVARQIPAGTLVVMKDGVIVYERGFGWQDRNRTVLLPPNALLRLASVVKPITEAAIRQLIAAGQLSADDRVFCLTGSPANCLLNITPSGTADANAVNITVQHLMDHMGGWDRDISGDPMFDMNNIATSLRVGNPPTKVNVAQYMLGRPLDFVPGSRDAYSNFGYLLLGLIIEDVTGKSFVDYIHDSIFTPLCVPAGDVELGRSLPQDRNAREPWYSDPYTADSVFDPSKTVRLPDGGFYIEDMDAHGGLIASGSAIAEFLQAYWINGEPRSGNGQTWWFFGSLPGTHTLAYQRPDGINIVALFNQREDPSGSNYEVIKELLDTATDSVTTWPSTTQVASQIAAIQGGQETGACFIPSSKFIDTSGAIFDLPDEAMTLTFPPAAVPAPVTVTFTPKQLNAGTGFQGINKFFELNAVDEGGTPVTSFQNPIEIKTELPADLGGRSPSDFRLYWLDGDTWSTEGLETVSLEGNTLTSTTMHFSTFAVLAAEEPAQFEDALFIPMVQH